MYVVRQIQSSTNYIYGGVCLSMVLAVIVLATLLFQANHGAVLPCSHLYAPACPPGHLYGGYVAAAYSRGCLCAAAHDHDHQPCSSYTDCGSCAGKVGLTGVDIKTTGFCMWCAGNQTCALRTDERKANCLVRIYPSCAWDQPQSFVWELCVAGQSLLRVSFAASKAHTKLQRVPA